MAPQPSRGEIWLANLDPIVGNEQAGTRPILIVTTNDFNYGPAGLVWAVPLTSRNRGISLHVPVFPPEGGLHQVSYILCEKMRSISKSHLKGLSPLGIVSVKTMAEVEDRLRILLDLS